MINNIIKFAGINSSGAVIAISQGYAHSTKGIQNAHFSNTEEEAKNEIQPWINSYPDMFGEFVIVPVTISYDLEKPIA